MKAIWIEDAGGALECDRTDVTALVTLEQLDTHLFRNRLNHRNMNGSLFGGQVLSQSLAAAAATVDGRLVHSLHGYFLHAGQTHRSVFFQVEATRDGRSFSTRRVTAVQQGRPIFHMECSFHADEPGYEHQTAAPAVPAPDGLADIVTLMRDDPRVAPGRAEREEWPVDVRPVDPEALFRVSTGPCERRWMRISHRVASDDRALHAQLLAYLSDFGLAGTALARHEVPAGRPEVFIASLDHAMWFHRPARADEWLLFEYDSPSASGGTGFSRGLIFDEAGRLVASTAQESLQRLRR